MVGTETSIHELSKRVTGRPAPLFTEDVATRQDFLREKLEGARILVIGAAGSIGSATAQAFSRFRLASLHLVDQNENGLADLIRDFRNNAETLAVSDVRTLPLDFGSPIMKLFLDSEKSYDLVLNFAAIKHVRSEKDVPSLLQMLDTNVNKPFRLMGWLAQSSPLASYFCVSTDKAANPTSLMGASKRAMEHLIFSGEAIPKWNLRATSARFANVAFSNGSLLLSFLQRLQNRQPLACPEATKRYFISMEEAGQICMLAAVDAPSQCSLIPRFTSWELLELEAVARRVLEAQGLNARLYHQEEEAKARVRKDLAQGYYPVLLTPLDTSGEKPFEEFVGEGEETREVGLPNLLGLLYQPAPTGSVGRFLTHIQSLFSVQQAPTKEDIVGWLQDLIPQMRHTEAGRNLDQRI